MIQFCAPVPVSVQVDVPVLVKTSKSRNWAAGPILLTLKLPVPAPPSARVSLPPPPRTLPLITLPGSKVRLLVWLKSKRMAVPPVPVIVPELMTAVGPEVICPVENPVRPVMVPELIVVVAPPLNWMAVPCGAEMVPEFVRVPSFMNTPTRLVPSAEIDPELPMVAWLAAIVANDGVPARLVMMPALLTVMKGRGQRVGDGPDDDSARGVVDQSVGAV